MTENSVRIQRKKQYSNIYGDNFSNSFWLTDDTDGENEYFQLATIRPERLTKHTHINITGDEIELPKDCPDYVKYFISGWKEAVLLRPTKFSYINEDRGIWSSV